MDCVPRNVVCQKQEIKPSCLSSLFCFSHSSPYTYTRKLRNNQQVSPSLLLTNSSSILVWHFSKLIRFMATRSCLGLHRAAWTTAVAPLPEMK